MCVCYIIHIFPTHSCNMHALCTTFSLHLYEKTAGFNSLLSVAGLLVITDACRCAVKAYLALSKRKYKGTDNTERDCVSPVDMWKTVQVIYCCVKIRIYYWTFFGNLFTHINPPKEILPKDRNET